MERRELGRSGLAVSALGLGCMGMSEFYGTPDEPEAIRTIHRALELGVTLLDTADVYGYGANERLVGRALSGRREQAIVATKLGIVRGAAGTISGYDGRPEYVRSACDASLERLGIDAIDLYQLHRPDPRTPIEETVGAMVELVRAGKVRYLGLSEVRPEDLRRAAAVAPIASLQSEYSLFERSVEAEILPACAELGIGFLAYAPLGRGLLTGRFHTREDLQDGDSRLATPRFAEGNLDRNVELVRRLEREARERSVTPGQLALAWVLAQRPWLVPIPGTKRVRFLEENVAACGIRLSPEEAAGLAETISWAEVSGERYPPERMPGWVSPRS